MLDFWYDKLHDVFVLRTSDYSIHFNFEEAKKIKDDARAAFIEHDIVQLEKRVKRLQKKLKRFEKR